MKVIGIINSESGSGRTTTAAWMLHALHEYGLSVAGVDIAGNQDLSRWAATAGWPMPVLGWPTPDLHERLAEVSAGGYDAVVVDTNAHGSGFLNAESAMRAATDLVLVVPADSVEIGGHRSEVLRALALVTGAMLDGLGPVTAELSVLLPQVDDGDEDGRLRQQIAMVDPGIRVLTATADNTQRSADTQTAISGALHTGFGSAAIELLQLGIAESDVVDWHALSPASQSEPELSTESDARMVWAKDRPQWHGPGLRTDTLSWGTPFVQEITGRVTDETAPTVGSLVGHWANNPVRGPRVVDLTCLSFAESPGVEAFLLPLRIQAASLPLLESTGRKITPLRVVVDPAAPALRPTDIQGLESVIVLYEDGEQAMADARNDAP
ncbi:hypothetical protein OHA40_30630 [Nocardia sp. NBC_00508]|uniref:hypothetical protein n=1 Tax=Nocardia sp. NBC_00508 TaxID=2975992 RepID=UPI002E7FC8E3|nr:hypothetical protein [Nocardia sp. NBC_00508]WUD65899.1 hypothetical protein OHA40_30630 [Nocardia sp. NBC_00508]